MECSSNYKNSHAKSKKYYYYNNNTNEGGLGSMIRKGPWKPEEDQVLINHVKIYGPRDWSSIRSKGLLQRTGKSCRLRWVNKLRPNLKNGCKFTAEEERIVIELQREFGNKWAKISTYLVGRTDNDVKNFWSSRQKRLSRLLHSQSPPSSNKKHKSSTSKNRPHFREVSKNSSMEGESSSKAPSLNSSSNSSEDNNTMELIPFPGSSVSQSCPVFEANTTTYLDPIPLNTYYNNTDIQLLEMPSFPSIPHFQTDLPLFLPETQELIDRLDYSFFAPFGCTTEPALINDGARLFSCFGGGGMSGETRVKRENDNYAMPDSFFDDFPSDVFDEIEPLPSPPH